MKSRQRRDERKILQLCRQVERRLSLVFAGEIEDPALDGLVVQSVTAVAGAGVLKVDVALPDDRDETLVMRRLGAASSLLRGEVAAAIHRKRTPRLVFSLTSSIGCDPGEY